MVSGEMRALKRAHEREHRITVSLLREMLAAFEDDDEVTFGTTADGDPLLFHRLKNRGPIDGPAIVHVELHELTDDAMRDEIAWEWVRRVGALAEAILFVEGEPGTGRPSKADTAALKEIVAALKADPTLLDAADGLVFDVHPGTNADATRAVQVVGRWAGVEPPSGS